MFNGWLALAVLACGALGGLAAREYRLRREFARRAADAEQALAERGRDAAQDGAILRRIEEQLLEKQQRLDHLAHHDPLTGLPNRLFLAARLPDAIAATQTRGTSLAVLFLDLDRFKHVNDTRGHETGDKLLQEVARRIRGAVRSSDLVVRMGGDEFVVVLEQVRSAEQVHETAGRITAALAAPVVIDGRPLVTTASIGVSVFPRDGGDAGSLLRHSDTAMYQAKERGRNNFQVFSPVMDRKLKERVAVETSLRAAIQAGHLDLHYQPILDVRTRRVVALEALVRWRHPKNGLISPARFIPVAEETGLIVPIGEFVLARAIKDLAGWRAAGREIVPVAINVSARQLRGHDLRRQIVELTALHDLSPTCLQIELTESAMIDQPDGRGDGRSEGRGDAAEDIVDALRALGVGISIDDFGTGYSSLSYLKRWPVDTLKIDRSFVRDLVTDGNDYAIVGAIIAMARHLQIDVIAEGVEGWPQLEALRRLGCRYAQGFLFAVPQPADECAALLHGRPLQIGDEASEVPEAAGEFEDLVGPLLPLTVGNAR
jgi:diguanylate cyclase (GGDEF)-like protein